MSSEPCCEYSASNKFVSSVCKRIRNLRSTGNTNNPGNNNYHSYYCREPALYVYEIDLNGITDRSKNRSNGELVLTFTALAAVMGEAV